MGCIIKTLSDFINNSAPLFNKITLLSYMDPQNHHYINFAGDMKKAAEYLRNTNMHTVAEKQLITAVSYTELSCTSLLTDTAEHMNQCNHKNNTKLNKAEIHVSDSRL